jgi:hypothetical protein
LAVYNYNASDATHIDQNLTDFEGAADGNGFSIYIPTNLVYNPSTNTTTVTYSYMMHERTNNFSTYSCTTYAQYKTNGATAYTKSYNPATTIQYTAMTTNRYYWMGNNDGTPTIAFTSIPTTGTITSPTASAWSFTVNHDAGATPAATTIQAYIDSNTNVTYVPEGTTITATLTTILGSATTNLGYVAPGWTGTGTGVDLSSPTITRSTSDASKINVSVPAGARVNTNINDTIYYGYAYSLDNGVTWSTDTVYTVTAGTVAVGKVAPAHSWSNISITAGNSYTVLTRVRASATATGNTLGTIVATSTSSASISPIGPFISPSNNVAPTSRSTVKVWNSETSSFVTANMMVYNGTSWQYLK